MQNQTYSDQALDYYGNMFVNANLHERGINFNIFMEMPEDILVSVANKFEQNYKPLLNIQTEEKLRIESDEIYQLEQELEEELQNDAEVCIRNRTHIEKMRHRSWPRKQQKYQQQ